MKMKIKLIIAVIIFLTLSGCSPVTVTQSNTFILKASSYNSPASRTASSINLLVSEPTAPEWLNTTNMVYQKYPSQLNYFSKNEWADTPAHLLQNSIVQGLQQSGQFHVVMSAPFVGNYDRRLDMRIFDFSQDFTQQPSQFHVKVLAIVVNGRTQQVVASKLISVDVPASMNSPAGGVQAANKAASQLNTILLKMVINTYK